MRRKNGTSGILYPLPKIVKNFNTIVFMGGTADVYTRITDQIVSALEQGVRPWMKPWDAEHAAGRITRPLRHNGIPCAGINVVMLWLSAVAQGFAAPIWMTFRQAKELGNVLI